MRISDWSSDVCSSDLGLGHLALLGSVACAAVGYAEGARLSRSLGGWQVICWALVLSVPLLLVPVLPAVLAHGLPGSPPSWAAFVYVALMSQLDRKSTRLNSSH